MISSIWLFGSDIMKIGWGDVITSEPRYPHEIIQYFISINDRIIQKCIPLYEKGLSFRQVSNITGVPASSIFDAMKKQKRTARSVSIARKTNPPYGYAWLSGKLVINPVEYQTVELIKNLSDSGMRPYHIEKHLNERAIPTRNGGKWFARIITNILEKVG